METVIGNDIEKAAWWLLQNEVVAIPTETVYGLAANALNDEAVLKIFKAKNRPHFNPLIVHTYSWQQLQSYVTHIPDEAQAIAAAFCPGPITFLLPRNTNIPDLVTAGHPKVAIRIPAHPLTLSLLQKLPFPLAAPSANRFGYVSPTTAAHVYQGLQGFIPYILDGGPANIGLESTIIDFENDEIILRRQGGIAAEAISELLGKPILERTHASDHPVAPGQLKSHYATQTPLFIGLHHLAMQQHAGKKMVLLEFGPSAIAGNFVRFNLSPVGNLDEAARNLFAMMRNADEAGADLIIVNPVPNAGLGAAINDRLQRAAHFNKQ